VVGQQWTAVLKAVVHISPHPLVYIMLLIRSSFLSTYCATVASPGL
jgi:hypothetical protein